ncbi:RES family NAD+ phosphorylase [Phocoenobacter atlanticus]|uniref:RES family NAD+ phosphorylase n=1 Tax=Phocoenobacter atlanticus TaxID=3416742 RepID=UPI00277A51E3|nr:RES family NAD+ phosphorylase [Pasteurella atlantica]MDP8100778.1 RES family NAD+ phosphorylase [Pasteurella atlantica]
MGNHIINYIACSKCFEDKGLGLEAWRLGDNDKSICKNCGEIDGRKLVKESLTELAHNFFVWGAIQKCNFGGAPVIQFNETQKTSINVSQWLKNDISIFEKLLGIGFFLYGPRLWMVGDIEPLKELQDHRYQDGVIKRIIDKYPTKILISDHELYRIRKSPRIPNSKKEYDSPPIELVGSGRLDDENFPVFYASEDLDICLHECRITAEDDIYLATLKPTEPLKMLDLTKLIDEKNVTEFESLDMAIHMLFLAASHAYPISRKISKAVKEKGYDGIIYPSYFSLLRLGIMPFQTTYGLSHRRLPQYQEFEQKTAIPNMAIFGYPISDKKLDVICINKLVLSKVVYDVRFGPVDN